MQSYYKHLNIKSVIITGKDSIDYLQRISTNNCSRLREVKFLTTCFLNDKGKLVDICDLFYVNSKIYLISCSTKFDETIKLLQKYIITDDVEISKNIDSFDYLDFVNCDEKYIAEFNLPYGIDAKSGRWKVLFINSVSNINLTLNEIKTKEFTYLNITSGLISVNENIYLQYNPLELNLWEYISFTKGCYLGQEIIARLDSYQKVSKILVLLSRKEEGVEQLATQLLNENGEFAGKIIMKSRSNSIFYYLAVITSKMEECLKFKLETTEYELVKEKTFRHIAR